ncbi:enoyl-CoA hydratase/isomerase family protein [Ottowia sp. VDI28]|uniref:enoyl-CoA hydratase/isomerase family protein n=1 Tax=Ottowia sp. VDI28 TaxID=3133968 RepID=UPI003C2BB13E
MSEEPLVVLERHAGVAVLTLNRLYAKNALDPVTTDALTARLRTLRDDETVRAVVLTGAGDDFCAGGDVKAMGQGVKEAPSSGGPACRAITIWPGPWRGWTSPWWLPSMAWPMEPV